MQSCCLRQLTEAESERKRLRMEGQLIEWVRCEVYFFIFILDLVLFYCNLYGVPLNTTKEGVEDLKEREP